MHASQDNKVEQSNSSTLNTYNMHMFYTVILSIIGTHTHTHTESNLWNLLQWLQKTQVTACNLNVVNVALHNCEADFIKHPLLHNRASLSHTD